MDYIIYPALIFAGIFAGFINTVAGGGSTLTIPVFLLAGLPPSQANATNRIGILIQTISATYQYQKRNLVPLEEFKITLPWMLAGGGAGAWLAAVLPDQTLEPLIYTFIILAGISVFIKSDQIHTVKAAPRPVQYLGMFGAGFYGGFLQAGVGIVLLAVLHGLMNLEFKRANALKILAVLPFTLVSLAIFSYHDLIVWIPGLILSIGSFFGAKWAVFFIDKVDVKKVKVAFVVILVILVGVNIIKKF